MRALSLMVGILFLSMGTAQELSLENYLATVRSQNISVQQKVNDTGTAQWDLTGSYLRLTPTLNIAAQYWDSRYLPFGATKETPDHAWERRLSLAMPVFSAANYISIGIQHLSREAADIEVEYRRKSVEAEAVAAFVSTFVAQEGLAVAQKGIAIAEESLKSAKVMLESGKVTELDTLSLELTLENRRLLVTQLSMDIERNFANMGRIAAQKLDKGTLSFSADTEKIAAQYAGTTLDESFEKEKNILSDRSSLLRKLKKSIAISEWAEWYPAAALLPTISLSFTHDFGQADDMFVHATRYSNGSTVNDTVFVNFNLNLFNQLTDLVSWRKYRISKSNTLLAYTDTENSQHYALKAALGTLISYAKQKRTAELAVTIAEKSLLKARTEYQAGKSRHLDLLNAENSYLDAIRGLITVKGMILNSYYQVKLLTGEDIP